MALTTQWSQIERLQGKAAADSWQWFIDRYRVFVNVALRRMIWSPARAAAAADEFWGYLFESGIVERLQAPMRFRAFLVSTLRNYAFEWMRRNPDSSLEAIELQQASAAGALPEDEEIALWARQILHLALQRLGREHPRSVHALRASYGLPEGLEGMPSPARSATELAREMGCKPNALYQILFRARARLRDCVLEEVRQTVSNARDLEDEAGLLLAALGRVTPGLGNDEGDGRTMP